MPVQEMKIKGVEWSAIWWTSGRNALKAKKSGKSPIRSGKDLCGHSNCVVDLMNGFDE